MKIVAVVSLFLVGCGTAAGSVTVDADADVDVQIDSGNTETDSGHPQLVHDGGSSGDAMQVPDAIESVDAGPQDDGAASYAVCRAAACAPLGATGCGKIATLCGGQPVDCGTCAGTMACGDNGVVNQCGLQCANMQDGLSACGSLNGGGFNAVWAVRQGCSSHPYQPDGAGGMSKTGAGIVPNGCKPLGFNGQTIYCCP